MDCVAEYVAGMVGPNEFENIDTSECPCGALACLPGGCSGKSVTSRPIFFAASRSIELQSCQAFLAEKLSSPIWCIHRTAFLEASKIVSASSGRGVARKDISSISTVVACTRKCKILHHGPTLFKPTAFGSSGMSPNSSWADSMQMAAASRLKLYDLEDWFCSRCLRLS